MSRAPNRSDRVRGMLVVATLLGSLMGAGSTWADPPVAPIDLIAGWQAAAGHDPQYAAALAEVRAGQAKARQGDALWRPNVALTLSGGWAEQRSDTSGAGFSAPGFGRSTDVAFNTQIDSGNAQSWALTLQQPLYNSARSAGAEQLHLQASLADEQLRAAQQALMLRVAQAHFAVLSAREGVKASQAEQAAAVRALGEAKERFAAGAVPVTEVDDAQARHDAVAAQGLAAQDALLQAQADYTALTGLPASQLADLPDRAAVSTDPGALADWQARARQQSPQLAQALIGTQAAQAEVRRHAASSGVSLDLLARAGGDRISGDGPYATSGSASYRSGARWVGLQLTVPLYTGGLRSAQEDEAAAQLERSRAQARTAETELDRLTRAAWLAVNTGSAQVRAYEQARTSAAKRLDATRTGLDAGDRTMQNVLDAERDLHASELAWQQARLNVLLGRLNLAAAAGQLDESTLKRVNEAFSMSKP